jgi:Acylphosphatases
MKRVYLTVKGDIDLPGVPLLRILKSEAERHGVYGEALLVNDTLYAVLEGPDESVERIIKFIPMASPAIKIREMSIREEEYRGDYEEFRVAASRV